MKPTSRREGLLPDFENICNRQVELERLCAAQQEQERRIREAHIAEITQVKEDYKQRESAVLCELDRLFQAERAAQTERDILARAERRALRERDSVARKLERLEEASMSVPRAPSYWCNQRLRSSFPLRQDLDGVQAAVFLAMLNDTCAHAVCDGRDGTFVVGAVSMVRVWRVENPFLWRQYKNKATEMASRHKMKGLRSPALKPKVRECSSATALPECIRSTVLDGSLNEVFLFHGTKPWHVQTVAETGFDERVCSLDGMLGAGLYFAEDSCKSGQYAERGRARGSHWFLYSRVLLGRPHHTSEPMPDTRRAPNGCDSVVFTPSEDASVGHHREFVVYDRFQAYPEYIIEACTA